MFGLFAKAARKESVYKNRERTVALNSKAMPVSIFRCDQALRGADQARIERLSGPTGWTFFATRSRLRRASGGLGEREISVRSCYMAQMVRGSSPKLIDRRLRPLTTSTA